MSILFIIQVIHKALYQNPKTSRSNLSRQSLLMCIHSLLLPQYFTANRDRVSLVDNILSPPIQTRHLRIHPWGWYGYIAMRVEFFGCRSGKPSKRIRA